jgi:hypothetical protein
MPNLIKVHVIKCLLCYDLGQIIDPFDQGKRKPCPCRTDPPQHWPCPCLVEVRAEGAELSSDRRKL